MYIALFESRKEILNIGRLVTKTADVEDKRVFDLITTNQSDTATQHIFACHCGKVQAQLLTPIQEEKVKEDNCSMCVRVISHKKHDCSITFRSGVRI